MKSIFFAFVFLMSQAAFANPTSTTQPFYRQIELLNEIAPYVERIDTARLFVVRNGVEAVKSDIEANVQAGKNEITFQTLRLIQNLIIQYRFSQVFFGWTEPRSITSIYTEVTAGQLAELKTSSDEMVKTYGYDDSPYTQITANTFRQMQRLLKQLEDLAINEALKKELRAMWMPIGETIAVAEQGDRPKTFEKAIPVVQKMRALYPMFDDIASSDAGFQMIMELQGLTEFYAEFAQVEQ